METIYDRFLRTEKQRERFRRFEPLVERFAARAAEIDGQNRFPFENIDELREMGYFSLTVPSEYGGEGIGLYDLLLLQEQIARGDAATALSVGWHVGCMFDMGQKRLWEEAAFAKLCREVVERGALLNRAATERATGSPTRGGKPQTTAVRQPDGWLLQGRKTFTTMAPALDYFLVTAQVAETEDVAEFVVPRTAAGVIVEPTWNMVGMRGTSSHDLVLDGVRLPEDALVRKLLPEGRGNSPYLLFIPAVYIGIALAARKEALAFAAKYQPNSLDRPILHVPHIRQLIGSIELELSAARHFMYAVAARWDEDASAVEAAEFAAVKTFVTNTAIAVVDKAMRIVGAHSLSMSHPLQRMYRDVRFGLHNPPMDDSTHRMLADRAANEIAGLGLS